MDKQEVIEKLKKLKLERGVLGKIEWSVGIPKNNLSGYVNGKKEMPKKWVSALSEYFESGRHEIKHIYLPKDFINMRKIMALKEDGSLVPIEDLQKDSNFDMWMQAFNAMQDVVDEKGKKMFFEYKPTTEIINPTSSPVSDKTITVTFAVAEKTDYELKTMKERIVTLESELNHPPKTAIIGVKNWIKTRQIELAELKSEIEKQLQPK